MEGKKDENKNNDQTPSCQYMIIHEILDRWDSVLEMQSQNMESNYLKNRDITTDIIASIIF